MKSRGPQPDVVIRLFEEDWQSWEFAGGPPRPLPVDAGKNGHRRTLAVPARQVLASPLWIEGTDPALLPEAAKLELEVRGLLSRTAGMEGVSLRLLPEENRTLAVAAVFPVELPEAFPPADRFDGSPFLLNLPRDAATLWREGDDYVAAFTRGGDVVYWETIDRSVGTDELRTWLSLIVQRLEGEGVLASPPRVVSWVEGVPPARIAPPGCAPAEELPDDTATGAPSLERLRGDWKPASAHRAEARRIQRARIRTLVTAIVAGYLVVAAVLALYAGSLRWKARGLEAEVAGLRADVEAFQPVRRDWSLVAPTVESSQYPLELLGGVVAALPEGKIHLTKFVVENGRIIVEGEADSFSFASDFYNRLSASEALRGINWDGNRNPSVGTSVTTFHAEGTLPLP